MNFHISPPLHAYPLLYYFCVTRIFLYPHHWCRRAAVVEKTGIYRSLQLNWFQFLHKWTVVSRENVRFNLIDQWINECESSTVVLESRDILQGEIHIVRRPPNLGSCSGWIVTVLQTVCALCLKVQIILIFQTWVNICAIILPFVT